MTVPVFHNTLNKSLVETLQDMQQSMIRNNTPEAELRMQNVNGFTSSIMIPLGAMKDTPYEQLQQYAAYLAFNKRERFKCNSYAALQIPRTDKDITLNELIQNSQESDYTRYEEKMPEHLSSDKVLLKLPFVDGYLGRVKKIGGEISVLCDDSEMRIEDFPLIKANSSASVFDNSADGFVF